MGGKASGDRISGFWLWEVVEHVCGVGSSGEASICADLIS